MITTSILSCLLTAATIVSPNGKLGATFDLKRGNLTYRVDFNHKQVVTPSRIDLVPSLGELCAAASPKTARHRSAWRDVLGERCEVRDDYNALSWQLRAGGRDITLEARCYDEGVAWRLVVGGSGTLVISDEDTTFTFADDYRCWPVYHAQGKYQPCKISEIDPKNSEGFELNRNSKVKLDSGAERPLVIEGKDFVAAIGEAANLDFARMKFKYVQGAIVAACDSSSIVTLPATLPWRYVRVARDVVALYNGNGFLKNLNPPSRMSDLAWIKPGKVLRVAKLDEPTIRAAVDLIPKLGFDYIELDCGWYGPDERRDDPLKPLPYVKPALAYAKEKGVPVILYVNRDPLKRNLDAILSAVKSYGAVGVKYGFVDVGKQEYTRWLTHAIERAAEERIMLDIHDEFRLTGIERTYPHILTVEGICGNEEMPDAAHNAALVFTRYLAGPGDYTPCWRNRRVKNSLAHQLAMTVTYFSPWQFLHWYSRPEQIKPDEAALDFWRHCPTVWDDTRALAGKIGEYAVIARRKGAEWFVGALNAGEMRTLSLPLTFLGDGKYQAHVYCDQDPQHAKSLGAVRIDERVVTARDVLSLSCAANGGFAIRLVPL